jgi:uncharacterized protein YaiL (DUF2058 family)
MCRSVGILPERIMTTTPTTPTDAITAVQNGTLAQAILEVCAERDRLRKENAILQEANRGLAEQLASAKAWSTAACEQIAKLNAQVEQLLSEVYEQPPEGDVGFPGMTWKEAAEQAGQVIAELQVQCAAMRDNLTSIAEAKLAWEHVKDDALIAAIGELALSALSTDSRKGYVPADKARMIAEAVREVDTEAAHCLERDECEVDCETVRDMCREALAIAHELGLLEPPTQ